MMTIVLCLILLLVIWKVLFFSKDRKFIFLKRSLHFIFIGAGSNILFYYTALNRFLLPYSLFVIRALYHAGFFCCLYCFLLYMKHMLDMKENYIKVTSIVTRVVFIGCCVLDFFSPLTKWGLYEENGKWYDSVFSPFNFFYVYTAVSLFLILAFFSSRLIRSVRICLFATEAVVAIIMLIQGIRNVNTFSGFTYLLPVLVVLIMLHSKPFDDKTGALAMNSFESFVQQKAKKGISVDYIVLKLYISMVNRLPDELGKVLNSFWHEAFKDALLFDLSSDLFVLAIPRNEKNGNTEQKINAIIHEKFADYYVQYQLTYKIIEIFDIDFVDSATDMLGIIKYLLQSMEENSISVVDEKKKEQLKLYKIIQENLARIEDANDLDDPRVLVYCQPIRNMKTGKYDTAEALMRLNLPGLGLVMPYLFIELAEQYKHIHALSIILLNKLCRQIKKLEEEGYEFQRISVNFAASEIISDGFCDEVLEIIGRNGVDPHKIGIELTETQTERDFKIVKRKMKRLREAGIALYLDDVGTGYSNMDRIVHYDVDVVKFDRFFLLEAEKSMKIIKMMMHLSQAFRDLDYKLLYEGVETDAHEALCMSCGADYIQGFKYSQPVPVEEIRNFFENDAEGRPTKVVYTTRSIEENMSKL